MNRFGQLRLHLAELARNGVCLAFSGGADSALLLKLLAETAEKRILAVTFSTRLHPPADLENARRIAAGCGVPHLVLEVDEFQDSAIRFNPPDRCYRCKKQLFTALRRTAAEHSLAHVIDGTNADDLGVWRPGLRVLRELGIGSPLAEFGISKAALREYGRSIGCPAADRPAAPCLATRLPYGAELKDELLAAIDRGEEFLRSQGIGQVRLRFHEPVLRIEVGVEDFGRLLALRERVIGRLHELGFTYLTLDLEGFRSGSMDLR